MAKKESGNEAKFASETTLKKSSELQELFKDSISDLYWAENHLVKSLPKMISATSSPTLKNAIETHLEETKTHVTRLEKIFELLGKKAIAKKCDAMEGLTKEAEGIVEETEAGTVTRDLGIILASQKVEHYEIASYAGLHHLAITLGLQDIADILAQTLNDEQKADDKLSEIAENGLNYKDEKEVK